MARKAKKDPTILRDIPYIRCYEEMGMIETEAGIFTRAYEIMPPKHQKEITYSAKRVRDCMKSVFLTCKELSFQFVIRNSRIEKEEYLQSIRLPHGRNEAVNACADLYNDMIDSNIDVGHNNFKRHVYLVVSAEYDTPDEAAELFSGLDEELNHCFGGMYGYMAQPQPILPRGSSLPLLPSMPQAPETTSRRLPPQQCQ